MGKILNLVGVGHHSYVDVGVPPNLQHVYRMRSGRVVRASICQCQSRNSPWFDRSILRHSVI
jgi:hypothetical protein